MKTKWTHEYKLKYMKRYNAINRDRQREWFVNKYNDMKENDPKKYEELKKKYNEYSKKYQKEHRQERTEYMRNYYNTPEGRERVKAAKEKYRAKLKEKKLEELYKK